MFTITPARFLGWVVPYSLLFVLLYWFGPRPDIPANRAVMTWSFGMISAAVAALAGSIWLGRARRPLLPLFIALAGSGLVALAQLPPILAWMGHGRAVVWLTMAAMHVGLLVLALFTLWRSFTTLRPLARPVHYGAFVLACAAVAAAPYAYRAVRDALWIVTPNYPDGSVVPLHAHFHYTWPSTKHYGTNASVRYADGGHAGPAATGSGQGWTRIYPSLLEPDRNVIVTIRSTAGSRTYRYRTASVPDRKIDLYRAVIAHWFRPPQGGAAPAVILERIEGLSWTEQEAVEDGVRAWAIPATGGMPRPVLALSLGRQGEDDVILRAAKGNWTATLTYRTVWKQGRWEITPLGEEPRTRPWGP